MEIGVGTTKSNLTPLRIWGLFLPHSPPYSPKIIQNFPLLGWDSIGPRTRGGFYHLYPSFLDSSHFISEGT